METHNMDCLVIDLLLTVICYLLLWYDEIEKLPASLI